jgi:hypothetical protein
MPAAQDIWAGRPSELLLLGELRMHLYLARRLESVFREPLRELLKYKYRRLRFRGLARLYEQLQPKYKRRLKWQITDAALEARSREAIAELDRIFSVPDEALDALYAPIRAYLAGDVHLARQKAQDLVEDEDLDIQVRHGSFFWICCSLLQSSRRARLRICRIFNIGIKIRQMTFGRRLSNGGMKLELTGTYYSPRKAPRRSSKIITARSS